MCKTKYKDMNSRQDHQNHQFSRLALIGDQIRKALFKKNTARDKALSESRALIRLCANTIRSIHRGDMKEAKLLLVEATESANQLRMVVSGDPDLYFAGYTQDGLKEFVEANILLSLVSDVELPGPDELQVESSTYLKGLSEAATELRRTILDIIRIDHSEEAERLLEAMDEIYSLLVTIDFPDAITGGLRRNTDVVRSVRERTRGDLTMSVRQQRLEKALNSVEKLRGS